MSRSRTVLVAGAGIGGLASAIALANGGFRVLVFERNYKPDTSGAGIQLSPNATRALKNLGVLELNPRAVEPSELVVANAISRALLAKMPLGSTMREKFGAPYLVCLRADLHDALAKTANDHPDIEMRYGSMITDFASHSRGVTAQIEYDRRAEEIQGAALIGADGIRSQIRARLHPGSGPRHGGMSAWRATIPAASLPEELRGRNEVFVWLGPGAHLVHYPVGDGSEVNLVAVTMDRQQTESWGEEAATADVVSRFAQWNETPRKVLRAARQFRRWSLYEAPLVSSWGKGAVTLLGDAAHGMFPFLAQGAASALEDAVALGEKTKDAEDMPAALRAYERIRLPRTREMQSAARNIGRIYHLPMPFSFGRDLVMERIGGQGLLLQNEWIYRG
ncbi:MAG: FAD-dependent monooxygenase [Xanthobacteraceae bacterium]|nr:FAD-dependent monooxygenase [Xanthobacteraceae bacterium]